MKLAPSIKSCCSEAQGTQQEVEAPAAEAAQANLLLLPLFRSHKLRAWPKHASSVTIAYLPSAAVLQRKYATDAHTAAYCVTTVPRRLDKGAPGHLINGAALSVAMSCLFVDVDGADHKASPDWRAGEAAKVAQVLAAHPGGFCYQTRGGYRLVWRLAAPFSIANTNDAIRWCLRYRRILLYLARRFGVIGDPVCANWTRLYRLPHATRPKTDGSPGDGPEELPTEGDPDLGQPWTFEPTDADLGADLAEARRLLALHPTVKSDGNAKSTSPWSTTVKALAQAAGEPEHKAAKRWPSTTSAPSRGSRRKRQCAEKRKRRWCEKALRRLCRDLARTSRGTRNNALRDAALILGHYAPHLLDPAVIEAALLQACEKNRLIDDDGREAVLATLQRALSDGMREPKHPPLRDEPFSRGQTLVHEEEDWTVALQRDRTGYRRNLANIALILSRSPGWRGCLAYDEFTDRISLLRCPPSHGHLAGERFPRHWRDADDVHAARWLQTEWQIDASSELVSQAVVAVAHEQRVHPVRAYLDGLAWDGAPRLGCWLTAYLGVRATSYSQAVGPMVLRAAVARIYQPGCKADTILVLQGPQGIGKSTGIKILCGPAWFTDDLSEFGSKDAAMQLRGAWFIEVAELAAMTRGEVERVKGFISRAVDRYRAAYGRHVQEQPRQCVFFGTTNADAYLRDETGNRRFWPVQCAMTGPIDLEGLARDRDQLWAEAVVQYRAGLRWHLDPQHDAEALKLAAAAQGAVYQSDPWEEPIAAYCHGKKHVTVAEILGHALSGEFNDPRHWTQTCKLRVVAVLRRFGWVRKQARDGGRKVWRYYPPATTVTTGAAHTGDTASEPEQASVTGATSVTNEADEELEHSSTSKVEEGALAYTEARNPALARALDKLDGGSGDGGDHKENGPQQASPLGVPTHEEVAGDGPETDSAPPSADPPGPLELNEPDIDSSEHDDADEVDPERQDPNSVCFPRSYLNPHQGRRLCRSSAWRIGALLSSLQRSLLPTHL